MLVKTSGIVLSFIKYKESSIIVRIFTKHMGLQHYIVNSVRSTKGKSRIALFQPLTLLDITAYFNEKRDLHRLSEAHIATPFKTIPFDPLKGCITIFLVDVLSKVLKGELENDPLYDFLEESITTFDQMNEHYENFHIIFLLKITHYLGFGVSSAQEIYDQLIQGNYHININENELNLFNIFLEAGYHSSIKTNNYIRRLFLDAIISYYQLHVENFDTLRSLEVLKSVFD